MDSPSDLFCQQSSPMCPFGLYRSPSGSAPSAASRYPGGSPPSAYPPLVSPLLHPSSASQSWGGYRQQQQHHHQRPGPGGPFLQAPSLEPELEDGGVDDAVGVEDPDQEDELLGRDPGGAVAAAAAAAALGSMAGPTLLSHLFPGAMRRGVAAEPEEWGQDVLHVKRLRMEHHLGKKDLGGESQDTDEEEKRGRRRDAFLQQKRKEEDEDVGRAGGGGGGGGGEQEPDQRKGSREGRKRQRQELKLQLQETRQKLLELQRRVWKACDKQQTQGGVGGGEGGGGDQRKDNNKGRKSDNDEREKARMDQAEAEMEDEMFLEDGDHGVFHNSSEDFLAPVDSSSKTSQQNVSGMDDLTPDETMDLDVELERDAERGGAGGGAGGLAGSVWVGCGVATHGEWEGPGGGQKFAQALKQELGSAVARVIDRVIRLYAEAENTAPPGSAALVVHNQRSGGLGSGLPTMEDGDQRRHSGPTLSQALEQADASSLVPRNHQPLERRNQSLHTGFPPGGHRGGGGRPLPPQSSPGMPHLPQPPLQALLPPPPRAKDPFLPAFPSGPPAVPLPLLHYTMQHLFARSLSNLPLHHKDSLPPEPFLDFRSHHGPSFPPLPLLGQLEPPLSSMRGGREGAIRDGGIRGGGGGGLLDGGDGSLYLGASSQEGLSPCHLKKAKLMFFYTRYPSSNTLKTYFPDVKFNRCVTSQLIKWFSNFREFFYIQMERFARQAVRDGVLAPREGALRLGRNSELYRILNMHYNKSNDYQVPERFLEVAELALREFFIAIQGGRDTDPCWKKSIYKIICKLDSPVPDSFRLPGCPVDTHRSV
ncbi:prospero homeobox 3 isoform X2 [Engraulis encrasicolus]